MATKSQLDAEMVDKLIDGAAWWQRKWRRDGALLSRIALEMDCEILALRQQIRSYGFEPVDGEWTRNKRPMPLILERPMIRRCVT